MHKTIRIFTYSLPVLVLLFLIAATSLLSSAVFGQKTGVQVIVNKAEHINIIQEIPMTGTVVAPRVAKISSQVSGMIETMPVDIGDLVKSGEEILRLNSELDELALAAALALTKQAKQQFNDAKRRLDDAKMLANRQVVSDNELQSLEAEVRIERAAVERYRAEDKHQAAILRRHTLKAPFTGVISKKLAEVGEWIQPGQAVVELVAIDNLRVDFQAPQSIYRKLDQTTAVTIKLDAFPAQTFTAHIENVIPVTDIKTRTFLIRLAIIDSQLPLIPGMSASALLRLDTGKKGVVVARDALLRYPDGRVTVWTIENEESKTTVSEKQVKTGLSFNGKVNITQGLSPDDVVVVQGNEALREGQVVTVQANR